MIKRVFLIVLDSFGIGAQPDANLFGDEGSNTLGSIVKSKEYHTPNMRRMGLFNIEGVTCEDGVTQPMGSYGRMREASMGKDTTIGHWEIAGILKEKPLPTYPEGFPRKIIEQLEKKTGRGIICNKPYSGTQVIADYGQEHLETGNLIVYTSADSVLQIAAHEEVVPVEALYEYCKLARELMTGEHGVGRVIARPFTGKVGNFVRTPRRHDYSLVPPGKTMLDYLKEAGFETRAVGKISDIFAGVGITQTISISGNTDGVEKTMKWMDQDFEGLCFVNLVDFDMVYGHRNDVDGYAKAAATFDRQLNGILSRLGNEDVLMITADHGCDPGTPSTDHSREYTPLMVYGSMIKEGVSLGTRNTFGDIGCTILDMFGVENHSLHGTSFLKLILKQQENSPVDRIQQLIQAALKAQENSYSPYSNFQVGAAILSESGDIYEGCNVENASYGATNCAERTAVFHGIAKGEKAFNSIAIVGGFKGKEKQYCTPCGICLQVLKEFAKDEEFLIILAKSITDYQCYTLKQLLPQGFDKEELL